MCTHFCGYLNFKQRHAKEKGNVVNAYSKSYEIDNGAMKGRLEEGQWRGSGYSSGLDLISWG